METKKLVLVGNYWVDENNNKWNKHMYSENLSKELSNTLTNCTNCIDCTNCRNCTNCIDCIDCTNCRNCIDFQENPQIYTSKKMGSRNDSTTFYKYKNDIIVVCGCFYGDLDSFEQAVKKTHENNKHGTNYLKEIEKVRILFVD